MSAPHEPGGPRDSLVRAQFAPDNRRSVPDDPARLALVLDNHDTVARLVRVELSGPLARYTRPRRQPRLELQSRRQQEVTLEVRPEDTRPEGGHTYDLHAVVIDEKRETVIYTCTARIAVERAPSVAARAERAVPYTITHQETVQLKVHVRNTGNVSLLVGRAEGQPGALGSATTSGTGTSGWRVSAGWSGASAAGRARRSGCGPGRRTTSSCW